MKRELSKHIDKKSKARSVKTALYLSNSKIIPSQDAKVSNWGLSPSTDYQLRRSAIEFMKFDSKLINFDSKSFEMINFVEFISSRLIFKFLAITRHSKISFKKGRRADHSNESTKKIVLKFRYFKFEVSKLKVGILKKN